MMDFPIHLMHISYILHQIALANKFDEILLGFFCVIDKKCSNSRF